MNWIQRIERAIVKGHFNDTDRKLASDWTTCATGEALHLDKDLVRLKKHPKVKELVRLGEEFGMATGLFENPFEARRIYYRIQKVAQA